MQLVPGLRVMHQRSGGRVHAFLLDDSNGLTLIDTLYDADAGLILAELTAMGKSPKDITRILLSHSHKSHIAGLATIAKLSGAPVLSHEWEAPIIGGTAKAKPVGFDRPKPFSFEVYALQIGLNMGLGKHTPVKVSETLKDGMKIGPVEVIGVPGHTPGSVAFWWPEKKILITGDVIATWPQIDAGWPTFNLDDQAQARSVNKLADLSECKVLCVGHGDPVNEGAADVLKMLAKREAEKVGRMG